MAKRLDPTIRNHANVTRAHPMATVGVPGVPIYGGFVYSNEKNPDLTGVTKYTKFSETLVNVAIVGAGVRYFLNLVAKPTWAVEPADETPEAKEAAEFVKEVMEDMETPWARVARRAAMYRFYGYSIQEWTAKQRDDGKIGFKDIAPRPQSTIEKWDTDRIGTVLGVVQRSPQNHEEIYLPRKKLVYLVDDSLSDSPEGLGIVRHIYPYAERLKVYEGLEQNAFETDLRGIPIGRAPLAALSQLVQDGTITKEQKTTWETNLTDFIENHIRDANTGLLLDSLTYQTVDEAGKPSNVKQWDLELLQGKTSGLTELAIAIKRVTRNIAILLGVEQLLLGETTGGSYALARDKTNVFFLIVDATLAELAEAFQKDFIGALWKLNGLDDKLKPTMRAESIKFRDVEQVAKALALLAKAGAPTNIADPAVNEIRELLGLSRVPDEMIEAYIESLTKPDPDSEDKDPGGKGPEDGNGEGTEDRSMEGTGDGPSSGD